MKDYFHQIEEYVKRAYDVANKAREKGFDPEEKTDIPVAKDLAEKSVKLITSSLFPELENSGIIDRIRELEKEYGKNDERIAFIIGKEIAQNKFYKFDSLERAIEAGIRIGLSYMTLGTVTAPLEGIHSVKIKENDDGSKYLAVYYSGPIRSAGGTGQAMSVVLADYIRKEVNLDRYKPTKEELERYATEVEDYFTRVTKKQYIPTREETKMIAQNVPVEITGTPTENIEVSNYKDLKRVETNRIRGGMCLIYLDGLPLKALKIRKKLLKYGKDFGLDHWNWLEDYLELQARIHSTSNSKEDKYKPSSSYLDDIVGGRVVLGHPGKFGGFRLRYGRSRTSGDATTSIHPATMIVTNDFIAVGTQLRLEYPGKATTPTVCDSIHGPIVRLKNGDLIKLNTVEEALKVKKDIEKIIFLGDLLVPYGEFIKNGKRLVPSPFVEEWWILELEKAMKENNSKEYEEFLKIDKIPSFEKAIEISKKLKIPLHPEYLYLWNYISLEEINLIKKNIYEQGKEWNYSLREKNILERLWALHKIRNGKIILDENFYKVAKFLLENFELKNYGNKSNLEILSEISGIKLMDKAPIFLGSRMGRPEKARRRLLKGSPQILFPCGKFEGGRLRNLMESYRKGSVREEFQINICNDCNRITPFSYCPFCKKRASKGYMCVVCKKIVKTDTHCGKKASRSGEITLNLKEFMDIALKNLNESNGIELLKAPRKVMGKDMTVEPLEKGILRQKYDLYVNKDATIRYDASNIAMTHFKPKEINTSIEKLRELGYDKDIYGNELTNEEQTLMLKPQDIIISDNPEDSAAEYLFRVSKFIDDLLVKFYKMKPFYNLKNKEDLIGHLVIGLAPHTSAGIVGRIIGFTKYKCTFAHPYWHGAKKRDCFSEDEIIYIYDNERWKVVRIGDFIEELLEKNEYEIDSMGNLVLHNHDYKTISLNPESKKYELKRIVAFSKHIPQNHAVEIITEDGRKIRTTGTHPFLNFNGNKIIKSSAHNLKNAVIPEKIEIPERDFEEIDEDFLELLAFFLSKGELNNEEEVIFRNGNSEYLSKLIKKMFGIEAIKNKHIIIKSKSIYNLFKEMCYEKNEKRVPKFILSLPEKKIRHFLNSYFNKEKNLNGNKFQIRSKSRMFIADIEFLLLRCGIRYYVEFGNNSYNLMVDFNNIQEEFYFRNIPVSKIEYLKNDKPFYNLTVEDNHNLIISGITCFQCDGDEDSIILLMDALLNFSRNFLPQHTGGRSVSKDTTISYFENNKLRIDSIEKIFRKFAKKKGIKLQEFYEICDADNMEVISFDKNGNIVKGKVKSIIRHYIDEEIYEVRTNFGSIKVTKDHSLFTFNGEEVKEIKVENLKEGDYIAVPNNLKLLNKSEFSNNHEIRNIHLNNDLTEISGLDKLQTHKLSLIFTSLGLKTGVREKNDKYTLFLSEKNGFSMKNGNYGDLSFEKVLSVRKIKYKGYVYDLSVNLYENFLCGPHLIFAHNTMDAPLVISSELNPEEVDDESWTPEVVDKYSLEFYYSTLDYKEPWEVKIKTFEDNIKEGNPYESLYTHETSDINLGNEKTFYVGIKDMVDKVKYQLNLAEKILSVDENKVAELVLNKHFLGDLKGNLSKFGRQSFRCLKCNERYRRIPLSGKCTKCNGKLSLTVHEGTIKKYLEPSENIAENYEISPYLRQQIKLFKYRLINMFGKEEKQFSLGKFIKK